MRLDRFITLNVVRPLMGAGRRPSGSFLPILMYHSVSDTPESGVSPYYRTCTNPATFALQMSFLARSGYQTVSLVRALALVNERADLSKRLVITFDDGFRDFYTSAFPVLCRHGFSATMFLPTAFVGENRKTFNGRDCLNWTEIREMRAAGIEFASHTVNHPRLVELKWSEIEMELQESKRTLELQLNEEVAAFAYPYAFPQGNAEFCKIFLQQLADAGYRVSVTTEIGCVRPGDDALRWKRLPANSCDDEALIAAKLDGSYDWLAWPQRWVKRVKARF